MATLIIFIMLHSPQATQDMRQDVMESIEQTTWENLYG